MKRLLTLTALLIFSYTNAQDIDFITTVNNTNINEVEALSESIMNQSNTKYKLLKAVEGKTSYRYIYIPVSITEVEFKQSMSYDKALIIDFALLPGTTTLKLTNITANYNDVFEIWKAYIFSDANVDTLPNNYKNRRLNLDNYRFAFNKQMGSSSNVWSIQNQS